MSPQLSSCRSFPELWEGILQHSGDSSFLKIPSTSRPSANSYPYAAFFKRAQRVAYILREELGLGVGQRVLLLSDDLNDSALLIHACWLGGLVAVPLAPSTPENALLRALNLSKPKALFYSHSFSARVASLFSSSSKIDHWVVCGGSRDVRPGEGVLRLDDLIAGATGEDFDLQALDPGIEALRITKWDVEGKARQLSFSAAGLIRAATVAARFYPPLEERDGQPLDALSWSSMDPFSFEGVLHSCVVPFYSGIPHLWTDHDSPGRFWDQIKADGVSFALIDQATLRLVTTRGKTRDWTPPNVDIQVFTEDRICYEAFEKFEERFGVTLSCQYLKAEAGGTIAGFTVSEVRKGGSLWAQGYALPAIGYPVAEIEFAIENSSGKRLPAESPGEVIVRSEYLMSSMDGADGIYPSLDEHGRLRTGDEGFYLSRVGDEHFLFVTGCLRDFIVIGDERVNPALVECALLSIRGVSDARVIAFPNYHFGMELGAYVVPMGAAQLEEAPLIAALRRKVGHSQCPRKIVIEKLRGQPFPSNTEILKKFEDGFQANFRD